MTPPDARADAPADQQRPFRVLTAGSVDDGKSTLIGRLLHDCGALFDDTIRVLERRAQGTDLDFSQVTDGLEAEREQGITIDVAYRSFSTPTRDFLLADAPGHEQYTRNMVTAAAGSDAALILVDPTKLDLESTSSPRLLAQTRRHALLAHLMRVPNVAFVVNKIDLFDAAPEMFARVQAALDQFSAVAGFSRPCVIPVSAKLGHNLVTPLRSEWYGGASVLQWLEQAPQQSVDCDASVRLPIQYVTRDESHRYYWGRIERGTLTVGDEVVHAPSDRRARVVEIRNAHGVSERARAAQSVGVRLDAAIDVARGDWLFGAQLPNLTRHFVATVAWFDEQPATPGRKYLLRHGTAWVQAFLTSIDARLDVDRLQKEPASSLALNDIGSAHFESQAALPLLPYDSSRESGALLVVDPVTHRTSGALFVSHT